ncbi:MULTISPECIES: hypothetical protein [unclassified Variovorax]|jgi:hypothetical protein|uniref:hypothetical protein n=1 Tax=unclassified Variovorax TaxID=663243 RepID=UPI000F7ED3EA|nr:MULTISPECIES: hypothetical protein [unclassified Variovorax]RSZ47640.1 hypothetical protein EJO70_03275 [Variovorax sp. 553]RSZ48233.1 hypothetical protein EJO71_00710 [Variovorax sp. 679]
MKRTGEVQRCLQPVVELRQEATSYAYSVRAPRSRGVIPPSSYRDGGFATLADCLSDVARALGGDFSRIYVRLDGLCVGERDIAELRQQPETVAAALQAAFDAETGGITPRPEPAPLQLSAPGED